MGHIHVLFKNGSHVSVPFTPTENISSKDAIDHIHFIRNGAQTPKSLRESGTEWTFTPQEVLSAHYEPNYMEELIERRRIRHANIAKVEEKVTPEYRDVTLVQMFERELGSLMDTRGELKYDYRSYSAFRKAFARRVLKAEESYNYDPVTGFIVVPDSPYNVNLVRAIIKGEK